MEYLSNIIEDDHYAKVLDSTQWSGEGRNQNDTFNLNLSDDIPQKNSFKPQFENYINFFLPKYIKYFYELYMNIWISIFDKCLSLSEWNLNIKH